MLYTARDSLQPEPDVVKIENLVIYPVKGAQGVEVDSAMMTNLGLDHDRRFMFVDKEGARVNQKRYPLLAQVRVRFSEAGVVLDVEDMGQAEIDFNNDEGEIEKLSVNRRSDVIMGRRVIGDAEELVSNLLDVDLRLFDTVNGRPVKLEVMGTDVFRTSFTDGYPLLITNVATHNVLSEFAGFEIDWKRYRPNVVVSGLPAFAEESLTEFRSTEARILLPERCVRCSVPSVHQISGAVDERVKDALIGIRRDHFGEDTKYKFHFGMNAVPVTLTGEPLDDSFEVKVGDKFEVAA